MAEKRFSVENPWLSSSSIHATFCFQFELIFCGVFFMYHQQYRNNAMDVFKTVKK